MQAQSSVRKPSRWACTHLIEWTVDIFAGHGASSNDCPAISLGRLLPQTQPSGIENHQIIQFWMTARPTFGHFIPELSVKALLGKANIAAAATVLHASIETFGHVSNEIAPCNALSYVSRASSPHLGTRKWSINTIGRHSRCFKAWVFWSCRWRHYSARWHSVARQNIPIWAYTKKAL